LLEGEHPGLRERELEDWILGDRAPIDQLLNDIVVSPERKDVANHTDRLPLTNGQPLSQGRSVEIPQRVEADRFALGATRCHDAERGNQPASESMDIGRRPLTDPTL